MVTSLKRGQMPSWLFSRKLYHPCLSSKYTTHLRKENGKI